MHSNAIGAGVTSDALIQARAQARIAFIEPALKNSDCVADSYLSQACSASASHGKVADGAR